MDAALYMKEHKAEFDVIIVDSSDPVGPAESLYTSEFYLNMHAALRPGGIVCTQGECQWSNLSLIKKVMGDAAQIYPTVDYAYTCIPTYPSGQIGFILANKGGNGKANMRSPRPIPASMTSSLRYYNSTIHAASFVLPNFAADELVAVRAPNTSGAASSSTTTLILSLAAGVAVGAVAAAVALTKRK
jgi:spermidine synthase